MGARIGRLFGKVEDARILMLGLDAAGKTTILYMMKLGEVVTTIPTIGFNVETIKHGNITFTAWDVSARDKGRPLLRHYFANTQALIYVIDSSDHERMSEAAEELTSFLYEDELRDSLVLVFANKQDFPNAKSPTAISEALKLHKIRQHCHIIPTVATTGDGLQEGLQWIADMLDKRNLPKDSDELLQMKHPGAKAEYKEVLSSLRTPWQLFCSLFIGLEDQKTTK